LFFSVMTGFSVSHRAADRHPSVCPAVTLTSQFYRTAELTPAAVEFHGAPGCCVKACG
jgi:hypothetical protein